MNRIDTCFKQLAAENKKAFVAYVVAGDPHPSKTHGIVLALEKAGADIIELGLPFSDPLADGAVNQLGSQRALEAGATVKGLFEAVKKIRKESQIPLVLFTYYNPIFHLGVAEFARQASESGIDGVLILDLPPEEAKAEWPAESALKRISLIAPTTPEDRIRQIAKSSSGFIYYVSREGVTGMQDKLASGIPAQISAIRAHTKLPICVGFGISNPEQAAATAALADGVVVGSAIVNRIAEWGKSPELPAQLRAFVQPLAEATHAV
ncbi:MAG: tryptophan synthase subunit alpha [Methylacidiphilales bacterium]|nr:tryptophan synthase subunit alpha [Candidatus Methylacidiphilales bacterium]